MSTENAVLRLSYEAADDLSDYQYHFVCLDSDGKIQLPDSNNAVPIGILQNTPASGEPGEVMLIGQSKLVANGALAVGTYVRPEYVSSTDAGKGRSAGDNWSTARGYVIEASSAEDDLCSVFLLGPMPQGTGRYNEVPIITGATTTITTADAVTYTAAQLLGGYILRDPNGANRSDVTPTAESLIAAMIQAQTGNRFFFIIKNTADAAETITITAGDGVTLVGTMTIAQNYTKIFMAEVASTTTITIYSIGTLAH